MDYETTKALASDASDVCGIVAISYPDDTHLLSLCAKVLNRLNDHLEDRDQIYPSPDYKGEAA